jgi:hypothetical protein
MYRLLYHVPTHCVHVFRMVVTLYSDCFPEVHSELTETATGPSCSPIREIAGSNQLFGFPQSIQTISAIYLGKDTIAFFRIPYCSSFNNHCTIVRYKAELLKASLN